MKKKQIRNYRKCDYEKKKMYEPIDCICPRCRVVFKKSFEWGFKGKRTPRIYCEECRVAVGFFDNSPNNVPRDIRSI